MSDRLAKKIEETRRLATDAGLDLASAPLLVTFELPMWGASLAAHEVAELSRRPGTHVAVATVEPLLDARRAVSASPALHVIAERGLVCGLSGGATLDVYPSTPTELSNFAVALFAGIAPAGLRVALSGYASSGRQEAALEEAPGAPVPSVRELMHAIRRRGGTVAFGGEEETALVVDDSPAELEYVRAALNGDLRGHAVRVTRMPSGRFRLMPDAAARSVDRHELHGIAQGIAMSSDRFLEVRGPSTFGFVTESVARWHYGPEHGARRLAEELFGRPDTGITHLGLHPFTGEGTLFFAYEGSETLWEAANKGVACVTVRDILEYLRVLAAIRKGE